MDTVERIGTAQTRRVRRRMRAAVVLALAGGMSMTMLLPAGAVDPGPAVPLTTETTPVATGPDSQTDPHLSGSLLTWTDLADGGSQIRYTDLAAGSSGAIPNVDSRDSLSDVAGDLVVFRRVYTTDATRSIMLFDVSAPELGARELAPQDGVRRSFPAIGGTTVAFMQFVAGSSTQSELCIADAALPDAPAVCLTDEGLSNRDPDVSADGSTVTWAKCQETGTGCDVYVVRRGALGWGTVTQLTDSTGEDILPATDGSIVTYTSNAAGDYDIWWEDVDGTNERQLALTGSIESNPSVSGGAISFERELPGSTHADLYLYRPASGVLNQLTDTTEVDETLNAMSLSATAELRVAWASPDGLQPGHNDIHALRADLGAPAGPTYTACLLYDTTKAHRAGSTVPLQVRLCDDDGANLSAPELELTVAGLVKLDGSATTALAESPGNSNPDSAFRYDSTLAGYQFNLSTKGLSRGTWELRFTVDGSPTVHALPFDVR